MKNCENRENYMMTFSEGFLSDVLKKGFRIHLPQKTVENLISDEGRKERFSIAFGFDQTATQSEIIAKVEAIFTQNLEEERRLAPLRNTDRERYLSDVESYHNSEAYQDLSELLGIAGTLTPVLAGDWEIGRIEAANYNLGIKDLREFQEGIIYDSEKDLKTNEQPGQFRHLHKGPGDCSLMRFLREENKDEIADRWSEEGVGYELHHGPLEVLKKFIKPKKFEDPEKRAFLEQVILPQLRPALKGKWFDVRGSVIKEHVAKVDYFDCNDLYDLLLNPETWLKVNKTKLKVSREYEDDGKVFIDPDSYGLALQYAGETDPREVIKLKINRLSAERQSIKGDAIKKQALKTDITALREDLSSLTKNPATPKESTTDEKIKFLSEFFTHDFVKGLQEYAEGNKRPSTNLNRHVHTDAHNFVPSTFKDIPEAFEDESFNLITGSRSDSHENNEDFVEDLMQNLKLLRPGGVLMTDGIKESYTRVLRVQDFMNAFKKQPQEFQNQFCVKVTMRSTPDESGVVRPRPVSLIIQRAHPSGKFSISNTPPQNSLREQFSDDVEVCAPEEVLERPDIKLLDHARRRLLSLSRKAHDVDIFRKLHKLVTEMVHEVITEFAQKHMGLDEWVVGDGSQPITLRDKLEEMYSTDKWVLERSQMQNMLKQVDTNISKIIDSVKTRVTGAIAQAPNEERAEVYEDGQVHLFRNLDLPLGPYNHAQHIEEKGLADNRNLLDAKGLEKIGEKSKQLQRNLEEITSALDISTPITIVNFIECQTNQALVDSIRSLTNPDYVRVVDIDLSQGPEGNAKAFAELLHTDGIIISGGSLHDMHLKEGDMITQGLGNEFLRRIEKRMEPVVGGFICFSHQLLARLIGEHSRFDLEVQEGLLEFGPTNIKGLHLDDNPLFDGLTPEVVSTFMSHSGHLVSKNKVWKDTYNKRRKEHDLRALAKSEFTGKYVAFEAYGRQALSCQFHPEMNLMRPKNQDPDNVKLFLQQLRERGEEGWKSKFGIGVNQLQNQFRVGRNSTQSFGGIQTDAGRIILLNMLYTLSETLVNSDGIQLKRVEPSLSPGRPQRIRRGKHHRPKPTFRKP